MNTIDKIQSLIDELNSRKIVLVPESLIDDFIQECDSRHIPMNGGAFEFDKFGFMGVIGQYFYLD